MSSLKKAAAVLSAFVFTLALLASGGPLSVVATLPPTQQGFEVVVAADHTAQALACYLTGGIPGASGIVLVMVQHEHCGLPASTEIAVSVQFDAIGSAHVIFGLDNVALIGDFAAEIRGILLDESMQPQASTANAFLVTSYHVSDFLEVAAIDPAAAAYLETVVSSTGGPLPPVALESHAFDSEELLGGMPVLRGPGIMFSARAIAPSGPAGIFGGN